MSRICEITVNGGCPVDVYCSKQLAVAIHKIIGEERFNDSFITLTPDEIQDVILKLVQILDKPLYPMKVTYQNIQDQVTGYQKLTSIMWWWNEFKNTKDTLTFA